MNSKTSTQLYVSPNGDVWTVRPDDDGRMWVNHIPNQSSGGKASLVDADTFLAQRENFGPQHHALLKLLETRGMEEKAGKALGAAVVGVWGDLPRDIQEALFEAAVQSEPDEAFREQLAKLLHDRHPRTS
jgi:hypothetical protein